jgi:hypothetical protein
VPLTVDDLVEHLNMPAAQVPAEDTPRRRELERALRTATQELTRMTGLLDATTATAVVTPGRNGVLRLPYVRLSFVVVREPWTGGVVTPVSVDLLAGLVGVGYPAGRAWSVDCTRADPWPAALESAALDWAAHVYETQRTTLNPAADDDTALPSFALPNRVAQFARPYMLPGMA